MCGLFVWVAPMISIKIDTSRLERQLKALANDQVPYATAVALTRTAQDAAKELNAELPKHLDNPTPFTRQAFTILRATKRDLRAVVLAKPAQRSASSQLLWSRRAIAPTISSAHAM